MISDCRFPIGPLLVTFWERTSRRSHHVKVTL
jgi:hypothetical protein